MARTRFRTEFPGVRALIQELRRHPFVVDSLFALLLTTLSVAGLLTVHELAPADTGIKEPDALGVILAAMQTLPLAWRRRNPRSPRSSTLPKRQSRHM